MNKKIIYLIILFVSNFAQGNEVVLNLTFNNVFNLPYITLNIVGEDVVLTLDTGSRRGLHLPIELIDKIPNKIEQPQKIRSIDLSGNTTESRGFIVDNLALDSFLFKKIDVLEYKNWGMTFSSTVNNQENENIDSPVIGLGFFESYVLTMNFPENKIIISDEDDVSINLDEKWVPIPFLLNEEGLVIDMSDGIKIYKMILDSAASVSIIKEQSLSQRTTKITDGSDYQFVALEVSNIPSDKIEAVILNSLPSEFQSDGLLGVDFLSKNILKVDFKNKKIWIQIKK